MHTHLLSDLKIRKYCSDFLNRLDHMADHRPCVWVSLGRSGDKLVDVLDALLDERGQEVPPTALISIDRYTKEIVYREDDVDAVIKLAVDKKLPVALIDSAVHSGRTMRTAAQFLFDHGVQQIVSYGLIIKQTSEFVPTSFGLMIRECDRAFFQLPEIPNHRLTYREPIGILRTLEKDDIDRPFIKTEAESISEKSFSDLHYLSKTQGFKVYVYEIGKEIAGVICFKLIEGKSLFIDLVARDVKFKSAKVGGMLLRWAETFARHNDCLAITLVSVEAAVSVYARYDFRPTNNEPIYVGAGTHEVHMSKRLLYNIKLKEQIALDCYD